MILIIFFFFNNLIVTLMREGDLNFNSSRNKEQTIPLNYKDLGQSHSFSIYLFFVIKLILALIFCKEKR